MGFRLRGSSEFKTDKASNLAAVGLQATGRLAQEPCRRCSRGLGVFDGNECVVPQEGPGWAAVRKTLGTHCASCHFKDQGHRCSLSAATPHEATGTPRRENVAANEEDDTPYRETSTSTLLGMISSIAREVEARNNKTLKGTA